MSITNKINKKPKEYLTEKITNEEFKNKPIRIFNDKHECVGYFYQAELTTTKYGWQPTVNYGKLMDDFKSNFNCTEEEFGAKLIDYCKTELKFKKEDFNKYLNLFYGD